MAWQMCAGTIARNVTKPVVVLPPPPSVSNCTPDAIDAVNSIVPFASSCAPRDRDDDDSDGDK